jgi:hypothetical protein
LYPFNPLEWANYDGDGRGDNADPDDDNDGVPDETDAFPFDACAYLDSDMDGMPDDVICLLGENSSLVEDDDDDSDGIPDALDAFPKDASASTDFDLDGIDDATDLDDDNDGVPDLIDAFPMNPIESKDTDGDGIGNNLDQDDDNDGIPDYVDALPEQSGQINAVVVVGPNDKNAPNENIDSNTITIDAATLGVLMLFCSSLSLISVLTLRMIRERSTESIQEKKGDSQ